jgi:hypothetical protein
LRKARDQIILLGSSRPAHQPWTRREANRYLCQIGFTAIEDYRPRFQLLQENAIQDRTIHKSFEGSPDAERFYEGQQEGMHHTDCEDSDCHGTLSATPNQLQHDSRPSVDIVFLVSILARHLSLITTCHMAIYKQIGKGESLHGAYHVIGNERITAVCGVYGYSFD